MSQEARKTEAEEVRGLHIPLNGISLVLPDSVVLQVLVARNIKKIDDGPTWLVAMLDWQKRRIPLVSFEAAAGMQLSVPEEPRVIIIKSLGDREHVPFYGLILGGIPSPARFNEENLASLDSTVASSPLIRSEVLLFGEPSSIPDLDMLEEMLGKHADLIEKYSGQKEG